MKALKNFLSDLRKSEVNQLESDSIIMVSEHKDYYIVFSWDDQDNVYLVNHFYFIIIIIFTTLLLRMLHLNLQ